MIINKKSFREKKQL